MRLTVNGKARVAERLMIALAAVLGGDSIALFAWEVTARSCR